MRIYNSKVLILFFIQQTGSFKGQGNRPRGPLKKANNLNYLLDLNAPTPKTRLILFNTAAENLTLELIIGSMNMSPCKIDAQDKLLNRKIKEKYFY